MPHDELSFCELKSKEIVNEVDGRKLGRAVDLVFSPVNGCIMGIVAPHTRRSFFFKGQEIFIPFKNISKIGPDVILVKLTPDLSRPDECIDIGRDGKGRRSPPPPPPQHGRDCDCCRPTHHHDHHEHNDGHGGPPPRGIDECDFKCEKCMLFDCAKRWKQGCKNEGNAYVDGKPYN